MRRAPDFARLQALLTASSKLRGLSLSPIAYSLLNQPRLKPQHLRNFLSTYKLPPSPFFALFLKLKWEDRDRRAEARGKKTARISVIIKTYPRDIVAMILYLGTLEKTRNPSMPLWKKALFPNSLKRARELGALKRAAWIRLFSKHVDILAKGYRRIDIPERGALMACMLLECLPDPAKPRPPGKAELKSQFRRLSMECHPDRSQTEEKTEARDEAEGERFILIKKAYDYLSRKKT